MVLVALERELLIVASARRPGPLDASVHLLLRLLDRLPVVVGHLDHLATGRHEPGDGVDRRVSLRSLGCWGRSRADQLEWYAPSRRM